MSLYDALQESDAEKAAELVTEIMGAGQNKEDFYFRELCRAEALPLLRGMSQGFEVLREQLLAIGKSQAEIDSIRVGFNAARLVVSLYAASEVEPEDFSRTPDIP